MLTYNKSNFIILLLLTYCDNNVILMKVNENGVISFNTPWRFSHPDQFPTENLYTRNLLVVSPFWSDNDIRKAGAVRYVSFSSTEKTTNPEGQKLLDQVNQYVQSQQEGEGEKFIGHWLLAVHWDHVHPSPHGAEDHNGIPEVELEKVDYNVIIII